MNRTRILLAVCAAVAMGTCLVADDEFKSENDAKSLRGPDGKFTQVKSKDNPKAEKAEKAEKEKTAPKDKGDAIAADDVAKLKELDGKQATVKGKVVEVFVPKTGSVAILNFGKDHKTCFKVAIFKANFEKFGGVDEITKNYQGKVVRVEGQVKMYQGQPEIVATVPSQLKVGE